MNLIILTSRDAVGDSTYEVSDARAEHIRAVLRSKPGDSLQVGILDGPRGVATVIGVSESGCILEVGTLTPEILPGCEIDVICALPRPQTLKKVLTIAATMRVRRLFLIRANRVEKSYYHSPLLHPENQHRFLIEGLCQGKNTRLPRVSIHDRFRNFFEDDLSGLYGVHEQAARLLPDPETDHVLPDVLRAPTGVVLLAIGPEGGWVPFELDLMEKLGFQRFLLGPWVLRVEQALTASLAQIELTQKT